MQLLKEPQTNTKRIPRWLAKFTLYQTQNRSQQQILLELLELSTPNSRFDPERYGSIIYQSKSNGCWF